MFEVATVKLDIRGQKYHSNILRNVTPAEYVILQIIHSQFAVIFNGVQNDPAVAYVKKATPDGLKRRPMNQAELREKLILRYGEKTFTQAFPGLNPSLPKTFKEIETYNDKDIEAAEQGADMGWEDIPAEAPKPEIDLSLDNKKRQPAKVG